MTSSRSIDVAAVIDESPISAFQLRVFVLLFAVTFLDSYDTQSISFVAPSIARQWRVSTASFGLIFSAGLTGLAVGALLGGRLADRLGRRRAVVGSVAWFAMMTLVCALTRSYQQLLFCRFIAGIGLGGAVANFFTLIAEYAPARAVLTIVAATNWGTPLGAIAGGAIAGRMIEGWGWPSIFYLGGALPLLLIPVLIAWLPESVRFLARDEAGRAEIAGILARIAPTRSFRPTDTFQLADTTNGRQAFSSLFRDGLAASTLLLSLTMASSLLLVFCLVNYLPLLLRSVGAPLSTAVMGAVVFNLSGLIGSLVVSLLVSRFSRGRPLALLAASYAIGGLGAVGMWAAGADVSLFMGAVFFTGFFVIGAQISVGAYIANYYPTTIRGTGVGFCQGFSRIGALLGPLVGAAILAGSTRPMQLFLFCPAPALTCASCLLLTVWLTDRHDGATSCTA